MLKTPTAIALLCMTCIAGVAGSGTPHGRPNGLSAAAPTGLKLLGEWTELAFVRDSARVVYQCRAELSNPGPKREVELRIDFTDAQGLYDYASGELKGPEPLGAPMFAVKLDGRPVAVRCDTVGDSFRFRWPLTAPKGGSITVRAEATFPWLANVCEDPDHRIEWRPADDAVFDVSGATREIVFKFVPAASFMAVESWTDSAVFEKGAVTWRWRGHGTQAFDLYFDSEYADEHTDLFPGPYRLPQEKRLDNSYFEIFSGGCEKMELELDGNADSLSASARDWVEQARSGCRSVIASLSQVHDLSTPDTTSSGVLPPLSQPGLSDAALSKLNAVERRNLRYAVGLMWALDATKSADAILDRTNQVSPGR